MLYHHIWHRSLSKGAPLLGLSYSLLQTPDQFLLQHDVKTADREP